MLASAVHGFGEPDLTRHTTLFAQEDQPAEVWMISPNAFEDDRYQPKVRVYLNFLRGLL